MTDKTKPGGKGESCRMCHESLPVGWPEDHCGPCTHELERLYGADDNERWQAENGGRDVND